MARSMRSLVAGTMRLVRPFSRLETVLGETPAAAATCWIVTRVTLPPTSSVVHVMCIVTTILAQTEGMDRHPEGVAS
ncbi:hypothetical protein GCM10023216_09680 [Isoptericola chiayiensis]|uniref:Secreted protein n=1 Tax=Isoptericola chiayiensis TaxID=579446 RepID=A0ABP8Y5S9_9MICO